MHALTLKGLRKAFPGDVVAVDHVDLDIAPGELTALLGPSGCGKTTLLRMIAGLEAPSGGQVLLDDDDITQKPADARGFGMVFQSLALFPHMNVAENIAYSLAIAGVAKAARLKRASELLVLVQLEGFERRRIGELSGGQRQRVAIARALAQEPSVFLLDEPMSALDAKLREDMQVELRMLQQKLGITTVIVTHDQREAMTMADQIVVMSAGRVEQVGPPAEIYGRPASQFVAGFIGKANFLNGKVRDGAVELAGKTLRLDQPAAFRDGSEVTLCCRPETIELKMVDGPDGAGNCLPASITFIRDVGPTREYFLEAGGHKLTCEQPAGQALPLSVGDQVLAGLPPGSLLLYPKSLNGG